MDYCEQKEVSEKKTILLVEDDEMLRNMLRDTLNRGYSLLEAGSCSEARDCLSNHIDIALVDYQLPDGTGFNVLTMVREAKSRLPVLFITAYGTEHLVIKALRAGVADYIKKPLSIKYLREKISALLSGAGTAGDIENPVSGDEFIMEHIKRYIEENYREDLSRDSLAQKVCMCKHRFSRMFNDQFGQTVRSYVNNIRIQRARELLIDSKALNITNIAMSVGYRNVVHFERVFREMYGVSPREFRTNGNGASACGNTLWQSD